MGTLIFMEGDEVGATYWSPAPEALNYMALAWWANLIQKCHDEHQKGNRTYGAQFSSSIAAAYEMQSWELEHNESELSKACFFRRLALALARKPNNDTMAALKTKYSFSLLVKATFVSEERFVLEALRLCREAILLKPSIAGTKMLLARILLWFICDSNILDDALSDLEVAIKFIEESMVESPKEFNHAYGADTHLQRAFEARYIHQGEEDNMQRALSLAQVKEDENLGEVASPHSKKLSIARKKFVVDNRALDEVMRDMECETSEMAAQLASQPQGFHKIHHLMIPGLAREALEAGLLAFQSPVEVEDDRKQPASNFLIGMNYFVRKKETERGRESDFENAISFLEAAQDDESTNTEQRLLSSVLVARSRWNLGKARREISLLLAGMESMALLLEHLTTDASPSTSVLFDMMERSYFFWRSNQRAGFLSNAAKFASYLLREDQTRDMPPSALSAILCKGGEIAADICIAQPDQALLQGPLIYWRRCWQNRRAALNTRLHAMHLASKHLFRQNRYTEAFQYAKKAVELVRFACPAHLDMSEREGLVPLLNGISVDACALGIKLGRDKEALELLEQGRGILNFLPDAFADSLDGLRLEHPQLFVKFDQCRQSILAILDSRDPAEQMDFEAEGPNGNNDEDDFDQLTSVLEEIRQEPKFKNFYRPITAAEMQSLATIGPIVVLVGSSLLPYAVIVRQQSIQTVDLSPEAVDSSPFGDIASFQEMHSRLDHILGRELFRLEFSIDEQAYIQRKKLSNVEKAEGLQGLLHFLWHAVVEPINKVLNYEGPPGRTMLDSAMSAWKNRVTWIRTGNFSRMPFHVAMDNENVPFNSRAISSYVASFQSLSLSHSRHKTAQRGLEDGLLVTMPSKAKGGPFLKAENVAEEVSAVIKSASSINWSVLERPSAELVKDKFPDARFIHFICHGVEDAKKPRRSHLKLWKETTPGKGRVDPLFVSDVSTWLTKKTALVFLSACSVADTESPSFSDENLDIANSFSVAGVPDVVGSMWPVESSVATKVASVFWHFLSDFFPNGGILDGDLVARALQTAILVTGSSYPGDPLMWAGFIHIGGMGSRSLADVRGNADDDNEEDWTSTDDEIYASEDDNGTLEGESEEGDGKSDSS
ncbi:hypothetical protein MMC12_001047 [Toensbergia leucococca]|nr:hypothetical protein [Toensbergia leucococca]